MEAYRNDVPCGVNPFTAAGSEKQSDASGQSEKNCSRLAVTNPDAGMPEDQGSAKTDSDLDQATVG